MKTCFVTTFPPSKRGRNEHGFHVSRELLQHSASRPAGVLTRLAALLVADWSAPWM